MAVTTIGTVGKVNENTSPLCPGTKEDELPKLQAEKLPPAPGAGINVGLLGSPLMVAPIVSHTVRAC